MSSIVAKKNKKDLNAPGDKRQPGATSTELRRLMSDPLADLFSEVGVSAYEKSVKAIQEDLSKIFDESVKELSGTVTKKLGEYGFEESKEHFRRWMNDIVADVVDQGMAEIVGSLDSLVSSLSSTYSADEGGAEAGGDLMGLDIPEVPETEVEEIKEEPTPEETPVAETTPTPLETETPAASAVPAPAGGEMATGVPEAKASVGARTYKIPARLQQVYAASKQRFRLQRLADARISTEQDK
jgi:hypothetical protein